MSRRQRNVCLRQAPTDKRGITGKAMIENLTYVKFFGTLFYLVKDATRQLILDGIVGRDWNIPHTRVYKYLVLIEKGTGI